MVRVESGDGPVVLTQPHAGTTVPEDIAARLNHHGQTLADTDWHVDRLYDGLLEDATVVRATLHRYVIDVNRAPDDRSLYPGMNTTGLCPTTDFDGRPIYRDGQAPGVDEIEFRRRTYHAPYHDAVARELERVRRRHGIAILYDCHSIRSYLPYLFEGELPVFNIGTNDGGSCAPAIEDIAAKRCSSAETFDTVVNGRFKGGWTTRRYGDPDNGVHAIQMELAQRAYMTEAPPWTYRPDLAEQVRAVLEAVLHELRAWALSGSPR
jgi:N-formylglutamate deformylase